MKPYLSLLFLLVIGKFSFCQETSDIILQYTGESVTMRKMGENNLMWYSEKNYRMILTDTDKDLYPDSTYYIVKPIVTIFKIRESLNSKTDTVVRILYYYYKQNQHGQPIKKEAETYSNLSYNLSPPAKVTIKEASGDKLHFIVNFRNKDSDLIIDGNGKKDSAIFFVYTDNQSPLSNYALMISNIKATIIDGKKIN